MGQISKKILLKPSAFVNHGGKCQYLSFFDFTLNQTRPFFVIVGTIFVQLVFIFGQFLSLEKVFLRK